jgi:hypothetical protein
MKIPARRYATIASGKSLLRGKKGPPLSLEHVGTVLYTKVWALPSSDMFVVPAERTSASAMARYCARYQQYVVG